MRKDRAFLVTLCCVFAVTACSGRKNRPAATGGSGPAVVNRPPPPPPPEPFDSGVNEMNDDRGNDSLLAVDDPDGIFDRTIEEINADASRTFLEDVHFDFDSAVLSDSARATLEGHAEWLMTRYPNVTLLVEGHCDERGTVEYNLALGERRANAIVSYLVSLGVDASRLRAISYGKEFPLDPGHNEAAWARNRRGHFELTGK